MLNLSRKLDGLHLTRFLNYNLKWLNIISILNFFIAASLLIVLRILVKSLFAYLKDLESENAENLIIYGSDKKAILIKQAFEFSQEINGKKVTSTFTRTETLQIETFNGKTDTASVRWVNDCELVLQKLHPKTMNERKAISMTILATDENSYTFDYSFVGDAKKQRGTVTKLK